MATTLGENIIGFDRLPQTIPHFCFESFRRHNKADALAFKTGDVWKYLSGNEVIERVKRIAAGLAALGVKAGDRVAIISENRPEWSFVDLAILSLRAVNVPIYTTQAVEQIRFILENSGAKILFVSGKKLWKHCENAVQSVVEHHIQTFECAHYGDLGHAEARAVVAQADVAADLFAYFVQSLAHDPEVLLRGERAAELLYPAPECGISGDPAYKT